MSSIRKEQRDWRMKQIALSAIYKMFPNPEITESDSGLYDFDVIYTDETLIHVGIVVKLSTFTASTLYGALLDKLSERSILHVPLLLLCVNESSENVRVGYLLSWVHGSYVLHSKLRMQSLKIFLNTEYRMVIKSMDETIRVLSSENAYCLKSIALQVPHGGQNISVFVKYLRRLTNTYRMLPPNNLSDAERFQRYLNGVPQAEYPNDWLDDVILSAIRNRFADANVISSLMVLSTELRDVRRSQYEMRYDGFIRFGIDLSQMPDEYIDLLGDVLQVELPLEMYSSVMINVPTLHNIIFSQVIPVNQWKIVVPQLPAIKGTYQNISVYFG